MNADDIFGRDQDFETRVTRELETLRVKREARRLLNTEGALVAPPDIVSLDEWRAEPDPVLLWRIEDWQPTGTRALLAAQFKAGKTTARDNLVRSLVDGDPWLGVHHVQPVTGRVAVIDTEMGASQMRGWLRQQRIEHQDRVAIIPMRGKGSSFNLLDPVVLDQWVTRLHTRHVGYLVLDCLRPVLDALGLDEHTEAGRFLVAFDTLLLKANIAEALVIHHMGHTGERSRGDSRLRDWPDVEWRLIRQDDDPASPRFLTAFGRDVDIPESKLSYDAATRRLTAAGGSRRDARTDAVIDAVVRVLTVKGAPLNRRQIQDELRGSEHSRDAIDRALHEGVRRHRLVAEEGPKNSNVYRVSGSVRPVSGQCPSDTQSLFDKQHLSRDVSAGDSDTADDDAERI